MCLISITLAYSAVVVELGAELKLKDVEGAAAEVEEAAPVASLPRTDVVAPKEKPLAPPKAPPVTDPKGAPKEGREPLPNANPVNEPALVLVLQVGATKVKP